MNRWKLWLFKVKQMDEQTDGQTNRQTKNTKSTIENDFCGHLETWGQCYKHFTTVIYDRDDSTITIDLWPVL